MALDFLTDVAFPTIARRVTAEKVAEYVDATGDDPVRWEKQAPPSYAGALLFMAAPQLLEHPDVEPYTRVLVHLDQKFSWHRAIQCDAEATLAGRVERVRSRGGTYFVTFQMDVTLAGEPAIESTSTFLLGDQPPDDVPDERVEPPIRYAVTSERVAAYDSEVAVPELAKSVSRRGLVKYAAASGDFNPIHFDHEAARGAGLAGVVGHGLLTTAWVIQLAAAATSHPVPLADLSVRYRDPMYPGDQVTVSGEAHDPVDGLRRIDLRVVAGDRVPVTGRATVREA